MSAPHLSLEEAKTRLDVAALWRIFNLPGKPARSCRCPLHDDQSASFSVYIGKTGTLRWKCHAGCGGGGPVEFVAAVLDLSERDACRQLLKIAGAPEEISVPATTRQRRSQSEPAPDQPLELPVDLHRGSTAELQIVAKQRAISMEGIELASARGLLWFGTGKDSPAWIVTDKRRSNAQARRMDGGLWQHIGGKKAWTLPNSRGGWPLGAAESVGLPCVLLTEGGPDLLAAHAVICAEAREKDVAAVTVLGGTNHLPAEALELLAGKRVRIFPHLDRVGQAAAARWTRQLEEMNCQVDAFAFDGLRRSDGGPVEDLNDLVLIDADAYEAERYNLEGILP